MHAKASLSDSGTITEESSILNFPAINLPQRPTNGPEGMEEAAVMMTGMRWPCHGRGPGDSRTATQRGQERTLRLVDDYAVPNVSQKVVRVSPQLHGLRQSIRLAETMRILMLGQFFSPEPTFKGLPLA